METIKLSNLAIGYDKALFSNINCTFKENEVIAILGHSGIGKTTFFKTLSGFLKPLSGKIEICNLELNNKNKRQIAKQIGFLTQENSLLEFDNVFNNLLRETNLKESFWNKLLALTSKKNQEHILNVLEQLDIKEKAFSRIDELSSGQRQRVNIAKIILNDNKIILADEPTSNLDIKTTKNILELLFELKSNKTIFIILHNPSVLSKDFDKIMFFEKEKISIFEVSEEIICEIQQKIKA